MSAVANTTLIVITVTEAANKEKTLKEADAALNVNILDFCEEHYDDILLVIMVKIRRDKRKEVHARPDFGESPKKSRRVREGSQNSSARTLPERYRNPSEKPKMRDRLSYNDGNVFNRLGHRRGRPRRRDSSPSRDRPRSRDRLRGIEESYEEGKANPRYLAYRRAVPMMEDTGSESKKDASLQVKKIWQCSGTARVWFDELPPESIDGYKDLKAVLLAYFMQKKKYVKDLVEIHNIKQRDGETIKDFIERFKVETGLMKGAPECMRIFGFMHGVNNPKLTKRLNEHVPKTMEEMMTTITAFIRRKLPPLPKRKATHRGNHRTSLSGMFQSGDPTSEVSQGKDKGLTGNLSHLIKEIKLCRDQSKVGKKEVSVKEKSMKIYMVQLWHRMTRQKVTQSFARVREITFPPLAPVGGQKLRPKIKSQMVPTTTSLTGFSEETIWPLGQLRLLVIIGDAEHSTKVWMNFMIVRSLSPYNGIIGRPGIREIQAVPSTSYRMLKFSVDGEIVTIRSTILIPTEYATVTTASKEILKEAEVRHENFKPSDMTGVPRSVAKHRLNIQEGYPPVQQKKMGQALKRARAIQGSGRNVLGVHDYLGRDKTVPRRNKSCAATPIPTNNQRGPSLNGKLTSLNRFLSKLAEKVITKIERHAGRTQNHVSAEDIYERTDPIGFPCREARRSSTRYMIKKASKLRIKARQYELLEGVLYRQSFIKSWLRCVGPLQADYVIQEIHEGSCSMHARPWSVVAKAMWLGYYWPTIHRDARDMIRECNDCQIHHPMPRNPQQSLTPITAPWPVYKWGINIAGPFPKGLGKVKFLIVAMDYFTKSIEAKAVATITGSQNQGLPGRRKQELDEELPHVLLAHRTMIKSSHGDTPFCLTYRTKAVIPAEIEIPIYRIAVVDTMHNAKELRLNLDLLEERRERASIRETNAKLKMTKYYNARVRGVTFRPGDFVYHSNDASHVMDGRKLSPKWEGPYEVTKVLGDGVYMLRSMDGPVLPRMWNIANLKKCYIRATA
nr:hypothetical protein [Tanacetum cinerariifolium]